VRTGHRFEESCTNTGYKAFVLDPEVHENCSRRNEAMDVQYIHMNYKLAAVAAVGAAAVEAVAAVVAEVVAVEAAVVAVSGLAAACVAVVAVVGVVALLALLYVGSQRRW